MSNLKVGDKIKMLCAAVGFSKGQILEVYRLERDGCHLLKGSNDMYNLCGGEGGAYVHSSKYKKLDAVVAHSLTPHTHADLMLKYAQIAQYDDKPWEQFEYSQKHIVNWKQCDENLSFHSNIRYRLKPQPPVVKVGQTWVSLSNGQEVQIFRKPYPSEGGCGVVEKWVIGIVLDESINLVTTGIISELNLTNHFKRKE